ncbi:DUF3179 domain-containing protein [candidate division KSB1 bacterium]|nr:DUF3179 domain-containing protein [candidate division KSB1 bacterium]
MLLIYRAKQNKKANVRECTPDKRNRSTKLPVCHFESPLGEKQRSIIFVSLKMALAQLMNDVNSNPVVIAGMESADFYISYSRLAKDGTILTFDVKTETPAIYPFDLIDNEGTVRNILGKAVSGPRSGEQLTPTVSYNAYWFAWGTFFPDVLIYGE